MPTLIPKKLKESMKKSIHEEIKICPTVKFCIEGEFPTNSNGKPPVNAIFFCYWTNKAFLMD